MQTDLKPCPFCGETAITALAFIPWVGEFKWIAGCDGTWGSACPGYMWKLSPVYLTEEQAARTWNRRVNGCCSENG